MSQHSHSPEASRPDDSHSSGTESGYAVGYRRPPAHTRFKPGQSGNPKGRRKHRRNVRTVLEEAMNQRIRIREGERTRSVTKLDGAVLTMLNAALKGDAKAFAALINLLRSTGMTGEAPDAPHQQPITADDDALIADFLRRCGTELDGPKGPQSNETPAPSEATPSNGRTVS